MKKSALQSGWVISLITLALSCEEREPSVLAPDDGNTECTNPEPKVWAVPVNKLDAARPSVTGAAAAAVDWGPLIVTVEDDGRALHTSYAGREPRSVARFKAERGFRAVGIGGTRVWAVGDRGLIVGARTEIAAEYQAVEPAPTQNDLYGVWVNNAGECWAVGSEGTIVHGSEQNWKAEAAGNVRLNGVWGASEGSALWAVGDAGTVLERRLDGTWHASDEAKELSNGVNLKAIAGLGAPSQLWAIGELGIALHYDGAHWSRFDTITQQNLNALWLDALVGNVWAVGNAGTVRIWKVDGSGDVHNADPDWRGFNEPVDLLSITGTHREKPWGKKDIIQATGARWCLIDRWYACPPLS